MMNLPLTLCTQPWPPRTSLGTISCWNVFARHLKYFPINSDQKQLTKAIYKIILSVLIRSNLLMPNVLRTHFENFHRPGLLCAIYPHKTAAELAKFSRDRANLPSLSSCSPDNNGAGGAPRVTRTYRVNHQVWTELLLHSILSCDLV